MFAVYATARKLDTRYVVSAPNHSHIREAVRDCLERCYTRGSPLGVLAEYIRQLREQQWPEEDIRAVEVAVRRLLVGLTGASDQDHESNLSP